MTWIKLTPENLSEIAKYKQNSCSSFQSVAYLFLLNGLEFDLEFDADTSTKILKIRIYCYECQKYYLLPSRGTKANPFIHAEHPIHGLDENFIRCFGYDCNSPNFELEGDQEYIYDKEKFLTFGSRKLKEKKSRYNKFLTNHQGNQLRFDKISDDNIDDVLACYNIWKNNLDYHEEEKMLHKLLEYWNILPVTGAILYIDNIACGFIIGEIYGEFLTILFEKSNLKDAYIYIYYQYVREFGKNTKFINRQDDAGLEKLRKSKLSYDPEYILKKYTYDTMI